MTDRDNPEYVNTLPGERTFTLLLVPLYDEYSKVINHTMVEFMEDYDGTFIISSLDPSVEEHRPDIEYFIEENLNPISNE